jgi:hypothetical protein
LSQIFETNPDVPAKLVDIPSVISSVENPPVSMMFTATNLFKEHGSMALSRKANADKNRLKAAWKSRGSHFVVKEFTGKS